MKIPVFLPLAPVLALALVGCMQPKERQVVQSNDPIEVALHGQRDRLLEKAAELERLGRDAAALTIYESLVGLYPDDVEILARRARARRNRVAEDGPETAPEDREPAIADTGDDEHP